MKMKILFVACEDKIGGAHNSLLGILEHMKNCEDIQCAVISPYYTKVNEYCEREQIENYVIPYKGFLHTKPNGKFRSGLKYIIRYLQYHLNNKFAIRKINRIIDFNSITLIHTNNSRIDIGMNLALQHGIPHVWHIREFGEKDFGVYSLKKNYISYMNKPNNYFLAVSNAVKQFWVKKGIEEDKIYVIYNGIRTNKYLAKRAQILNNDIIKIIFSAVLTETKGLEELIEALNILNRKKTNWKLDIFGDGDRTYIRKAKRRVRKYNLEQKIHFQGYTKILTEIMKNYDIGVVCSKSEGFGRITVEYMVAGVVIVATNSGANVELIRDGENGFLYNQGSAVSLANTLQKLFDNIDGLSKIRKAAHKEALDKYDYKINAYKVELFYRYLLKC